MMVSRYFNERRDRITLFVDRNYSLRGSIKLHRAAVGWDIARAPLNLTMAAPQLGLLVAARAARKIGAPRLAAQLGSKRLTVHTEVGKELAWRLHADLLELPYQSGDRITTKDALAETILSDPRVVAALTPALEAIARRGDDPALKRLEQALAEYSCTLSSCDGNNHGSAERQRWSACAGKTYSRRHDTWSLARGRHRAASRGHVLPNGRRTGVGSLHVVSGRSLGGPGRGTDQRPHGGLDRGGSVPGIIADPVQRKLGLHQLRLKRMLDALERQMHDPSAPGFVVHDHYVARLLDLFDMAAALVRVVARGA